MPKKFLHYCEGLEPHIRLHQSGDLTKGLEIPRESDLSPIRLDHKTYTGVGETDSSLGGHKQNLVRTKIQRKGAVTPQETEPKLHASVGGSPVEAWVGRGSPQAWGHWKQRPGKVPCSINPLGGHC